MDQVQHQQRRVVMAVAKVLVAVQNNYFYSVWKMHQRLLYSRVEVTFIIFTTIFDLLVSRREHFSKNMLILSKRLRFFLFQYSVGENGKDGRGGLGGKGARDGNDYIAKKIRDKISYDGVHFIKHQKQPNALNGKDGGSCNVQSAETIKSPLPTLNRYKYYARKYLATNVHTSNLDNFLQYLNENVQINS